MSNMVRLGSAAIPIDRVVSVCQGTFHDRELHLGYEWGDGVLFVDMRLEESAYEKWWSDFLSMINIGYNKTIRNVIMPYGQLEEKHELSYVVLPLDSVKKVVKPPYGNPEWYSVFHLRGHILVETTIRGWFKDGNRFWQSLLTRLGIEDDPELMEVVL